MSAETDHQGLPPLRFGERVIFYKHLVRVTSQGMKHWRAQTNGEALEGIVIGKRTLANGRRKGGWDEPFYFHPSEHFTAYLIAYGMHRKPVLVMPEDVRR